MSNGSVNYDINLDGTDAQEQIGYVKRSLDEMHQIMRRAPKVNVGGMTGMAGPGQAILQASQFVDDLQYGIRGVMNQIPQLTMAFGGGMGVAGGIQLAVIGISKLYDWMSDTTAQAEELAKKTAMIGRVDKVVSGIAEAGATKTREAVAALGKEYERLSSRIKNSQGEIAEYYAKQTSALNMRLDLDAERAKGAALGEGVAERIALRKKEAAIEIEKQREGARMAEVSAKRQEEVVTEAMKRMREKIARTQANLAEARRVAAGDNMRLKDVPSDSNLYGAAQIKMADSKAKVDTLAAELKELLSEGEKLSETYGEARANVRKAGDEMARLPSMAALINERMGNDVKKMEMEAAKAGQAGGDAWAGSWAGTAGKAMLEDMKSVVEAATTLAQKAARYQLQQSVAIADLRLKGMDKEAEKLLREEKLLARIADIAEKTGLSREDAATAARKLAAVDNAPKRLTPEERREARRESSQAGRDMRRELARLEREERKRAAADPFAGLNARKNERGLGNIGLNWIKAGQKRVENSMAPPRPKQEAKPAQSPEVAAIKSLQDMLDKKLAVV